MWTSSPAICAETLTTVDGPIDFMLVDVWIPMALPALRAVEPKLRSGALVFVRQRGSVVRTDHADYLAYVRRPGRPCSSR